MGLFKRDKKKQTFKLKTVGDKTFILPDLPDFDKEKPKTSVFTLKSIGKSHGSGVKKKLSAHKDKVVHHTKKAAKHVRNHFSFTHNNPVIDTLTKWELRYHKTLHVLSFLVPLLILGYVIYMNILPFGYSGSLMLDVGVDGDDDPSRDIYLSDPNKALSPVQRYGSDTFREVVKDKPFYVNFIAPINIDEKTYVTMDIDYEGNSPLYIEYYDSTTNQTSWKRYYKDNYDPLADGYLLVAFFPNNRIYAKEEIVQRQCIKLNTSSDCSLETVREYSRNYFEQNYSDMMNPNATINWLLENAKYDSVYFMSDDIDTKAIPNPVDYHEGEWTEIDTDLRKNHQFYVYLNNSLNLTVTKVDYNWYNGSDDVSVELYDLDGNSICNDTIPDDGIVTANGVNTNSVVRNSFCNVGAGIYNLKLYFVEGSNDYPDYYIDNIKINTNKIVTTGTILPVSPTTLYTNANSNCLISMKYWHGGKDQDVIVRGDDNQIIQLKKEDISRNIRTSITGKDNIYISKGDIAITSNLYFSFNESSYFEPYVFSMDYDQLPEYVVYGGSYKSWVYSKDNISLKSDELIINNIVMVFTHDPI